VASVRLDKAAGLAFGLELAEDGRVQSRVRRLAAGAGPVTFGGHGLDHLFGRHRFGGFAEHLGRRIELAQGSLAFAWLVASVFGLRPRLAWSLVPSIVSTVAGGTSTTVRLPSP
jgi:hypothetical protein